MGERNEKPEGEAKADASERTSGSDEACFWRIVFRRERKSGFSVKVFGEGGRVVVVPRTREGVGGVVGRRVRRWRVGDDGSLWTY